MLPSDPHKRRRARNIALALLLLAVVAVFYVVSLVKFKGGAW